MPSRRPGTACLAWSSAAGCCTARSTTVATGAAASAGPVGTPITLLIAADDEVTRSGLHTLLASQQGITVAGEAADGVEALEQALRLRPDVVLIDVRMPRRNGIEATRLLLAESADPPKVVVITTFENDDYVTAALSAGASGFVLKRLPVRQIAQAVRVAAAGEAILFPATLRPTGCRVSAGHGCGYVVGSAASRDSSWPPSPRSSSWRGTGTTPGPCKNGRSATPRLPTPCSCWNATAPTPASCGWTGHSHRLRHTPVPEQPSDRALVGGAQLLRRPGLPLALTMPPAIRPLIPATRLWPLRLLSRNGDPTFEETAGVAQQTQIGSRDDQLQRWTRLALARPSINQP
ncbi:response regulator [Streptomyces sp. NBC_01296]|uniref:response regulator n=1 Tax=Streptomyces sp. NBC_01296 TaxID=2903816 RepID=UPI002E166EAA|nr:response regulator transcription factor [Streptomyces sp. NBC_01296]